MGGDSKKKILHKNSLNCHFLHHFYGKFESSTRLDSVRVRPLKFGSTRVRLLEVRFGSSSKKVGSKPSLALMVFLGLLTLLSPSNFAVVSVSWTWSAVVLSQWVWVQIFRPRKAQGNGKKRQPKMSKIVLHFSTFQGWFIFELFFPFSKFFNMFKFYYKKRQNPKKHHFFRFLQLA